MKGAYNTRPPRPKLCPTWSVQVVLDQLKEWSPASRLSLKCLTLKTAMLVALASAKRSASLTLLSLKSGFCETGESTFRFQPVELEKTEGAGHCAPPLSLNQFTEDPRLYLVFYLKSYVKATKPLRSSDRLFVSVVAPHGAASIDNGFLAEEGHSNVGTSWDWRLYEVGQQLPGRNERCLPSSCASCWGLGKDINLQKILF